MQKLRGKREATKHNQSSSTSKEKSLFSRGATTKQTLVPVHVPATTQYRHRSLYQPAQESWWQIGLNWFRYHEIQLRWDIERRIASVLHRRWGNTER